MGRRVGTLCQQAGHEPRANMIRFVRFLVDAWRASRRLEDQAGEFLPCDVGSSGKLYTTGPKVVLQNGACSSREGRDSCPYVGAAVPQGSVNLGVGLVPSPCVVSDSAQVYHFLEDMPTCPEWFREARPFRTRSSG